MTEPVQLHHALNGKRVYIAPAYFSQKEVLSHKVTVSEPFRKEFNQWLLEFFGREAHQSIADGEVIENNEGLFMTQKTFDMIRKAMDGIDNSTLANSPAFNDDPEPILPKNRTEAMQLFTPDEAFRLSSFAKQQHIRNTMFATYSGSRHGRAKLLSKKFDMLPKSQRLVDLVALKCGEENQQAEHPEPDFSPKARSVSESINTENLAEALARMADEIAASSRVESFMLGINPPLGIPYFCGFDKGKEGGDITAFIPWDKPFNNAAQGD